MRRRCYEVQFGGENGRGETGYAGLRRFFGRECVGCAGGEADSEADFFGGIGSSC
jgi:hypothetical protein